MIKAPTLTEKSKKHRDDTKAHNTSITQRLRTDGQLDNDSHTTGVVKPV